MTPGVEGMFPRRLVGLFRDRRRSSMRAAPAVANNISVEGSGAGAAVIKVFAPGFVKPRISIVIDPGGSTITA